MGSNVNLNPLTARSNQFFLENILLVPRSKHATFGLHSFQTSGPTQLNKPVETAVGTLEKKWSFTAMQDALQEANYNRTRKVRIT